MTDLFILNKYSGTHDTTGESEKMIKNLKTDDCIVTEYTNGAGDCTRIVKKYLEKEKDFLRVFVCGGDGMASEAAQAMVFRKDCALGVVPVGTGNDFVRSLDRKEEYFLDFDRMINGDIMLCDVLRCGDVYAINYVSAGYDCEVADNAQKIKRWPFMSGPLAYKISIFYCLFTKRKHTFYPVADKKKIEIPKGYKNQMLTVAGNGRYYGGGIKCTPYARLDDGLIEFMSIPTISVPRFVSLLSLFIKGEHINNKKLPFVTYFRCKELQLFDEKPLKIGVDGEMMVMKDPKIEIVGRALNIIVPKG